MEILPEGETLTAGATLPTGATAIHRMVECCRADDYPPKVAKLGSGWVVMAEHQAFLGYCLLLPDPVVAHLNVLEAAKRTQFLADMALLGDAVLASTGALRINYAMFGNAEPALHAHVIPRQIAEPDALRGTHPWAIDWSGAARYSDGIHGELKRRIAAHLHAHSGRAELTR